MGRVVLQQRRFSTDNAVPMMVARPGQRPVEPAIGRCEKTANDALLHPHLASSSFASAARHASFALVPVPQGERSYALPGQRTKLRESRQELVGGPNNSIWSTSGKPCSFNARRMRQVRCVSVSTFASSSDCPWCSTRKTSCRPTRRSPVIGKAGRALPGTPSRLPLAP